MSVLKTFLFLVLGIVAGFSTAFGGDAMSDHCRKEFSITRGQSPWEGYTQSYEQEQAGKSIAAVPMTAALEAVPHLASYTESQVPYLAIDRAGKRVVVNNQLFSDLKRPDATRMKANDKLVMGKILSEKLRARPWQVVEFLIDSQLIETYQHLEATIRLQSEKDAVETYDAVFAGTHIYFTNDRNEDPISFRVTIDKKTGEILVTGE